MIEEQLARGEGGAVVALELSHFGDEFVRPERIDEVEWTPREGGEAQPKNCPDVTLELSKKGALVEHGKRDTMNGRREGRGLDLLGCRECRPADSRQLRSRSDWPDVVGCFHRTWSPVRGIKRECHYFKITFLLKSGKADEI